MILTLDDLKRRARSRLDDQVAPYLWSDSELQDCINDTIEDAAVRANLVIQDDISIPFTQRVDLSWNNQYALPSTILKVRSVYLASQPSFTLKEISFRQRREYFNSRPNSTQTGSPFAYALDQTQAGTLDDDGLMVRAIVFIDNPVQADTAILSVSRLPNPLSSSSDVPEFDGIWHPELIYGVTARAYLKRDSDTFDPQRSARDFQLFEDRFGPRLPASVLRERQTDVPLEMYVG